MATTEMTRVSFAILVLIFGATACSETPTDPPSKPQTRHSVSPMGQQYPTTEAVVFAPGLVSIEGQYEYAMSIHPDGDQILFTVEVPDGGASVHHSRLEDGGWSAPTKLSLTGGVKRSEMEAFFSSDGKQVFFAPFDEGMDVRIWVADLTPEGFSNPRALGDPIAGDPAFYPVQGPDGTLFYTNLAKRAVYRAVLESGEVITAEDAGLDRGGHAFPAPDGSFMLMDSASLDSEGQRDIFVAFRNEDGTWGPAQPLGPEVNTEFSETCPALSPDGEYLFFSRYNEPDRTSNIYWVSTQVIPARD